MESFYWHLLFDGKQFLEQNENSNDIDIKTFCFCDVIALKRSVFLEMEPAANGRGHATYALEICGSYLYDRQMRILVRIK